MNTKKPVAVFINDVHYSLQTLKLAEASMHQAIDKANMLKVPLVVAGDLHDSKANLRGECVNAMIETFKQCNSPPYILTGNHDKINERSEEHSLNFLGSYAAIIDRPTLSQLHRIGYLIPYQHDPDVLRAHLKTIPKGSTLIMHQGLIDSHMGDYIQDKSAITKEGVSGFTVYSGHYHARQTIELPDGGVWHYLGNPYTVSYGEANDPEKGFNILYSDGSLEHVPTKLRKHIIHEVTAQDFITRPQSMGFPHNEGDLIWFKITGSHEELSVITRQKIKERFKLETFKLDLIPTEAKTEAPKEKLNNGELLDNLIDSLTNTSDDRKTSLKELWRKLGT